MASPDRARSLFLSSYVAAPVENQSSDEGTILYPHGLPKHRKIVDDAATDSGEETSGPSRTSTIRAVEDFFKEYRPPSFRLIRLSYLDKALPPPPPPDLDQDNDSTDGEYVPESHEYTQTEVAIHSHYSTRSSVSSTSAPRRDSNRTRVSIRSRYSTQTTESNRVSAVAAEDEWPRPSRRLSETSEQSRTYSRKQSRGSIPYRGTVLEDVNEEKETHKEKELHVPTAPERDPWLLEQTRESLDSDELALGSNSKGIGVVGEGPAVRNNGGVKNIMKTSSDTFISFYKRCAISLDNRKAATIGRGPRTSEPRQAGLFAGCFWSRDGVGDDLS